MYTIGQVSAQRRINVFHVKAAIARPLIGPGAEVAHDDLGRAQLSQAGHAQQQPHQLHCSSTLLDVLIKMLFRVHLEISLDFRTTNKT